jgi:hypothetical protein
MKTDTSTIITTPQRAEEYYSHLHCSNKNKACHPTELSQNSATTYKLHDAQQRTSTTRQITQQPG